MGSVSSPFSILVVCSANVCRSPLAEMLLRRWALGAGLGNDIRVSSAGIQALPGQPMCPQAATWAGIDPTAHKAEHASREVDVEMVRGADLVLALDRSHRGALARLDPDCRTRLFTLRQAAGIAAEIAPGMREGQLPEGAPPLPEAIHDRLRWLVAELDAGRILLAGRPEEMADIEDRHGPQPHGSIYAEVGDAIDALTAAMEAVTE